MLCDMELCSEAFRSCTDQHIHLFGAGCDGHIFGLDPKGAGYTVEHIGDDFDVVWTYLIRMEREETHACIIKIVYWLDTV